MQKPGFHIARWLVRHRVVLFLATLAFAVYCALMIPHININTDMTRYLPESSSMKQGIQILETELSGIGDQAQEYATSFSEDMDVLPQGLGKTIIIGVVLVFVVLIIMCSSALEVVLFLLTVGLAVLINVGSNALLPSVSMTTNMIAPVLQMVLSMDYSIILMNRYRQERLDGKLPVAAMDLAVNGTSSSILSSAFTTIVSLLMLCFIKLKIGSDLGIVLAKGVVLSLICNFTILPALIIWSGKAIEASRKKVPTLPSQALARFQYRLRVPIAIFFVLIFVSLTLLQLRTPIFFSPHWKDDDTTAVQEPNPMLLVYATAEESAIPAFLDSVTTDPKVLSCISYPSLADQPRTGTELLALLNTYGEGKAPDIPEDLLQLFYYAHAHPERTEQFSLKTLQQSADELKARGLVPDGFDIEGMIRRSLASSPKPSSKQTPAQPVTPSAPSPASPSGPQAPVTDTLVAPTQGEPVEAPVVQTVTEEPGLTYEQVTTPLNAAEMAAFMDANPRQIAMLYRIAGKRNGTMSPYEFIKYVRAHIMGKRAYAAFLPKDLDQTSARTLAEYEAVLTAGPTPVAPATPDSLQTAPRDTSVLLAQADSTASTRAAPQQPAPRETAPAPKTVEPVPYTAMDQLLDMYLSGRAYPSTRICSVLKRAGLPVSQEEIDLFYLYTAARQSEEPETPVSPVVLMGYLADTLLVTPAFAHFAGDSTRSMILEMRDQLLSGVGSLRGAQHSAAIVLTSHEVESVASFAFVDELHAAADRVLQQDHYWIGESEMYKELKDGFPKELLLLTLLTVLSIFLIVALNFRSVLIPIPLIMTVLSGVYANVWASGFGGGSMYYLSYLIVQGILMGATIDYSILFTACYRSSRQTMEPLPALEAAYKGSSHSILTSGIILALVPVVMSLTMPDPIVASILKSLSLGAFAVLLFMIFLLPGVLACLDPVLKYRGKRAQKN